MSSTLSRYVFNPSRVCHYNLLSRILNALENGIKNIIIIYENHKKTQYIMCTKNTHKYCVIYASICFFSF